MTTFTFHNNHAYAVLTPEQNAKAILLDMTFFNSRISIGGPLVKPIQWAITQPYGGFNKSALCRFDHRDNVYRLISIVNEDFDEVVRIALNPADFNLVWWEDYHVRSS